MLSGIDASQSDLSALTNPFIKLRTDPILQQGGLQAAAINRDFGRRGVFGSFKNQALDSNAFNTARALGDAGTQAQGEILNTQAQLRSEEAGVVQRLNELDLQDIDQAFQELGLGVSAAGLGLERLLGQNSTSTQKGEGGLSKMIGPALMMGANFFVPGSGAVVGGVGAGAFDAGFLTSMGGMAAV